MAQNCVENVTAGAMPQTPLGELTSFLLSKGMGATEGWGAPRQGGPRAKKRLRTTVLGVAWHYTEPVSHFIFHYFYIWLCHCYNHGVFLNSIQLTVFKSCFQYQITLSSFQWMAENNFQLFFCYFGDPDMMWFKCGQVKLVKTQY